MTLEIRGLVKEMKGKKVVIEEWLLANGEVTVQGEVVAVQVIPRPHDDISKLGSWVG